MSRLWLIGALALGLAVRVVGLSHQNVWLDEAFALDMAREPLGQMLRDLAAGDAHPPLFYMWLHWADATLHWPLEWYRFLLLSCGLATIALTWHLGSYIKAGTSNVVGVTGAFAVAISPLALTWDRVLRMYSIEAALAAGSWALLLAAARASERRWLWWSGYALCASAMVWTHYLGWVVLATQCAYAVVALRDRWPALGAALVAAFGYVPWLPALASQARVGGIAPSDPFVYIAADALGTGLDPSAFHTAAIGISAWVAVAALLVGASMLGRRTFLPFALAGPALQLALGALTNKNLLPTRYFTYDIWAYAIALALVITWCWVREWRLLAVALAGAVAAAAIVADEHLLFEPRFQFTDWRAVSRIVADNGRPEDVVVFDQGAPIHVVRSMPGFAHKRLIALTGPQGLNDVIAAVHGHARTRIWYVENQREYPDPQGRLRAELQDSRPLLGYWVQRHTDLGNYVLLALFGPERRM